MSMINEGAKVMGGGGPGNEFKSTEAAKFAACIAGSNCARI